MQSDLVSFSQTLSFNGRRFKNCPELRDISDQGFGFGYQVSGWPHSRYVERHLRWTFAQFVFIRFGIVATL